MFIPRSSSNQVDCLLPAFNRPDGDRLAEHAPLFSEGLAQLSASVFCGSLVDDYPLSPTTVALAAQVAYLRGQRAELRAQMAASPLCDINTYVTDFEALLQRMWALHCAADKPMVIRTGAD